jgi:hypothetical protein
MDAGSLQRLPTRVHEEEAGQVRWMDRLIEDHPVIAYWVVLLSSGVPVALLLAWL